MNGSDTISHYTRFLGFWEPNCNCCRVGVSKMAELLHLFAENGLVASRLADPPQTDLRLLAHSSVGHQPPQQFARGLRFPHAQVKRERLQYLGVARTNQALGLVSDSAIQQRRNLGMRLPVIMRLHEIERLERSSGQQGRR